GRCLDSGCAPKRERTLWAQASIESRPSSPWVWVNSAAPAPRLAVPYSVSSIAILTQGIQALPNTNARSFDLTGRIAIVTGGYGVLGGMISSGLAASGVRVVVLGRRRDAVETKVDDI